MSAPLFWRVPAESLREGDHIARDGETDRVHRVNRVLPLDGATLINPAGAGRPMLFDVGDAADRIVRWGGDP